ncbi:MAG: hypothetical protein ACI8PW_001133 [Methylophilaceae bacterium]|jgi:hypothetical protein
MESQHVLVIGRNIFHLLRPKWIDLCGWLRVGKQVADPTWLDAYFSLMDILLT